MEMLRKIFLFSLFGVLLGWTSAEENTLATLEPLAGEVQWLPAEGGDWQSLTEPILVAEGDQIQTGGDGWALLTFFDGVSSEILGNTHVLINTLDLPAEESESFTIQFDQLVGDTFNTVDVLLDEDSTFDIRTPTVTASVRGTEYYVMTSPTGQAMIITERGQVDTLRDWLPNSIPVSVEEGQTLIWSADGNSGELLNSMILPNLLPLAETASEFAAETADLPACGDGYCDYAGGEGLLVCRADCGSVVEFPERDFSPENRDRFEFDDPIRDCLREGTCQEFCAEAENAALCQPFNAAGYLDCTDPANAESCEQINNRFEIEIGENRPEISPIRPELPANRDEGDLNRPSIDDLRDRLCETPPCLPIQGNNNSGQNSVRPTNNNNAAGGNANQGQNSVRPTDNNNNVVGGNANQGQNSVRPTNNNNAAGGNANQGQNSVRPTNNNNNVAGGNANQGQNSVRPTDNNNNVAGDQPRPPDAPSPQPPSGGNDSVSSGGGVVPPPPDGDDGGDDD